MSVFTVPSHIIVSDDALEEAKPYLQKCGTKALIVTGKHIANMMMMEELKTALKDCGIAYTVFDGITGEPTEGMIETGSRLYKNEDCQFCIGIGGGSPLDAAKAIAVKSIFSQPLSTFLGKEITGKVPPIVAIPTTAGTGSEATKYTIITDSQKDMKMLLKGEVLLPQLAVVDVRYAKSAPQSVTVATALDALTHAIEAYTSIKASTMTDTLAIRSVTRIMKYLPLAYTDGTNEEARTELAIAALEAGICINNSSVTIVHGMSRPIGALFHVPHGISNAMLLKECLSFALDGVYGRFATLGRAIGVANDFTEDIAAATMFINEIERLCYFCHVPSLAEYGIEEEAFFTHIPKMATDAIASKSPENTRKAVTEEDCEIIYEKVYFG